MSDRLELDPDPTPAELEVVGTALARAHLLDAEERQPISAWRAAGLQESVDRAPPAIQTGDSGLAP